MVKSLSSIILFSGRGYLILWARCLKAGWHRSLQWPLKGKGTCHLTLESLCTRDFIQRSWALSFFFKRFISGFSCVHVCMGCWQRLGQGTRPDHLELESQVVVNCPAWVLGIAPGSSGRAQTTCWVISPVPVAPFYSPVTSVQLGLSKICKYVPRMVSNIGICLQTNVMFISYPTSRYRVKSVRQREFKTSSYPVCWTRGSIILKWEECVTKENWEGKRIVKIPEKAFKSECK